MKAFLGWRYDLQHLQWIDGRMADIPPLMMEMEHL